MKRRMCYRHLDATTRPHSRRAAFAAYGKPFNLIPFTCGSLLLATLAALCAADLPPMLDLPGIGQDPTKIDFARLPVLNCQHAVVTMGGNRDPEWQFRLHSYLAFYEGKYWCIWSHGRSWRTIRGSMCITPPATMV